MQQAGAQLQQQQVAPSAGPRLWQCIVCSAAAAAPCRCCRPCCLRFILPQGGHDAAGGRGLGGDGAGAGHVEGWLLRRRHQVLGWAGPKSFCFFCASHCPLRLPSACPPPVGQPPPPAASLPLTTLLTACPPARLQAGDDKQGGGAAAAHHSGGPPCVLGRDPGARWHAHLGAWQQAAAQAVAGRLASRPAVCTILAFVTRLPASAHAFDNLRRWKAGAKQC